MASQLLDGRFRGETDAGLPLVGGLLYTYASGTTTPKAAYTYSTLGTATTNPVVLNARGESQIWLGTGAYSLKLTDAGGTTIWTADGVAAFDVAGTGQSASDALRSDLASTSAGKGASMVYGVGRMVASIAALRLLLKTGSTHAFITGYYAAGDGGGGHYYCDAADTTSADNGITVIVAADGGRWKLAITGMVSIRQCGVNPSQPRATNSARLQAAIDWASPIGHCLYAPEGVYLFGSTITKAESFRGVSILGAGRDKCRFDYSTLSAGNSFLVIVGGSGYVCGDVIDGIGFDGVGGASGTQAIEIRGQCGQVVRNCQFSANAIGVLFHNFAAGSFTEYCCADGCDFQAACNLPVEYRKTSGNQSFHGSGLRNRCTINTPSSGTPIVMLVGADCLVYNAPLDAQIWVNASATLIKNNNTGSPAVNNCNWHGALTIEPFAASLKLGDGYTRTYFTGTVNSIHQNIDYGVLKHVDSVVVNSDGNIRALPKPTSKHGIALTTGANTIDISAWWAMHPNPIAGQSGATKAYVFISGPNYYFAHELTLVHNPYGGAGSAQIIATLFNNNVAAWGPPTYAFNSSDRLVITNALYPLSGVTCDISLSPIGWAQP